MRDNMATVATGVGVGVSEAWEEGGKETMSTKNATIPSFFPRILFFKRASQSAVGRRTGVGGGSVLRSKWCPPESEG